MDLPVLPRMQFLQRLRLGQAPVGGRLFGHRNKGHILPGSAREMGDLTAADRAVSVVQNFEARHSGSFRCFVT